MKVALLDDYQSVALQMADWSPVASRAEITVFTDHVAEPDDLVARLEPFDVVMVCGSAPHCLGRRWSGCRACR
jgi:hypothetical protein